MPADLARACDDALLALLPAGLVAALEAALAHGASVREVRRRVRRQCGRHGGLTCLAVDAWLRRWQAEEAARRN